MRHRARAFVDQVDFVTSVGFGTGPSDRALLGLRGRGPIRVITDLGVLEPDPEAKELVLTALHPGVSVEEVRAQTGWALQVSADLAVTAPPTEAELATLRAMTTVGRLVKLHHADDGPRDAPVLVLAGSLGTTVAMWEPQLSAGGPVPRDPRRPPRPRRLPDAARPVRDARPRRRLRRAARRPGAGRGGVLRAVAGRDGRHVPRLGAPAPDHQAHALLHLRALRRQDAVGPADRRRRGGRHGGHRRHGGRRWFTPEWAAAHPDVVTALRDQIAGTSDAGYLGCCRALAAWDHRDAARRDHRARRSSSAARTTSPRPSTRTPSRSPAGIPGARLEVLPGAHLATIESAAEASRLISEHAVVTTS